jgi:hypothetical protein
MLVKYGYYEDRSKLEDWEIEARILVENIINEFKETQSKRK